MALQTSDVPVQHSVAVQRVPAVWKTSVGQAAVAPEHTSAKSHAVVAALQLVPADWKVSAGQLMPEPLQVSATSQSPAEARQVPEER